MQFKINSIQQTVCGNLTATVEQWETVGEDTERKTTLTVSADSIITAKSLYANYSPNK